jgi:hypothetical protein
MLWAAIRRANADIYVHRGFIRAAGFVYFMARVLGSRWVFNLANDAHVSEEPRSLPLPVRKLYRYAIRNSDTVIVLFFIYIRCCR